MKINNINFSPQPPTHKALSGDKADHILGQVKSAQPSITPEDSVWNPHKLVAHKTQHSQFT